MTPGFGAIDESADYVARHIERVSPECGTAARQLAEMVHILNRAYMLARAPCVIVVESEDARAALLKSFEKDSSR